jgi:phosphoglycolate phosphatase
MLRAIGFDLDGTLLDSRGDIAAACNHALAHFGQPTLPEVTVAGVVGDGVRTLLGLAFGLPKEAKELDQVVEEFLAYYASHPVAFSSWMPGALETLDAFGDLPLALVTNKSRRVTMAILEALGVGKLFAFVYCGGDGPLKPDPEPLLRTVRALGVLPSELWYVGDGVQDVGAGLAAGVRTLAVLGGFHSEAKLREAGAETVLGSLYELAGLRSTLP